MASGRIDEMTKKMAEIGGLFDYGPERSRLLVLVWRSLATGRPVTGNQIEGFVSDLGIEPGEADQFLRQMSERDADDSIVGIMGLSLNDHPHKFTVNGIPMSTWCAVDTLFLPAMLGQTAAIESESPLSKETVRVTVSPEGVQTSQPAEAVVTIVVPKETDMSSVASIWMTFCHHIFFFASRSEAEQWAGDRDDIEYLSLDQAYELGQQLWSNVLPYAKELATAVEVQE